MSIIQKMLSSLLLVALVPAFVVGLIFALSIRGTLYERELNQLVAVATIQQRRIEVVIDQNREILGRITNRRLTSQQLDRYNRTRSGSDKALLQQFAADTQNNVKGFEAVTLLGPSGEVIASSRTETVGQNFAGQPYFAEGQVRNDVASNFFLKEKGSPGLQLVGPLKLDGRLVGVAVIEWDISPLLATAKDYSGLGDTGEIVLAKRNADGDAVYLMPLRFDAAAALARTLSKTETNNVVVQALSAQEGTTTTATDYRGQRVFAAFRHIPSAGWGLVAKIDQDEAVRPLFALANRFIVVMFILSVMVIIVAFYLARRLNEPIIKIAMAADRIRGGDLSARADVPTKDEIGQLAGTFNAMADSYAKIDQMKSEFVLLTSHQLRTPATAVKGYISMLLDGYAGKLSPKHRKLMEAAFEENERQISVINSILDVAKLEAGEMTLVRRTVDIVQTIDASGSGLSPLLASKGQKLRVIKPIRPVMLWVDPDKLQLVIDNFIHNAIKYSPPGSNITVELKHLTSHTEIRVKDEGIGIARKDMTRLFKRFSRIASPQTADIQGAGLGLYLADKLVTLHGGNIKVKSKEGEGTTFTIELPNISEEDSHS